MERYDLKNASELLKEVGEEISELNDKLEIVNELKMYHSFQEGSFFERIGDLENSIQYYEQSYNFSCNEEMNVEEEVVGEICINLAILYLKMFRPDDAIQSISEAFRHVQLTNYDEGIRMCFKLTGDACLQKKQLNESKNHLLKVLGLFERSGSNQRITSCFVAIGSVYENKGELERALTYYEKALASCGNLEHSRVIPLQHIGEIHFKLGNYSQSIASHNAALISSEKIPNILSKAFCYESIGLAYEELGMFREATATFIKSLDLLKQTEDINSQGICHKNIARVYNRRNNIYKAEHHYSEAISKLKEDAAKARCFNRLGVIYQKMKDFKKSRNMFDRALNLADPIEKALTYFNIAMLTLFKHEVSSSSSQPIGNEYNSLIHNKQEYLQHTFEWFKRSISYLESMLNRTNHHQNSKQIEKLQLFVTEKQQNIFRKLAAVVCKWEIDSEQKQRASEKVECKEGDRYLRALELIEHVRIIGALNSWKQNNSKEKIVFNCTKLQKFVDEKNLVAVEYAILDEGHTDSMEVLYIWAFAPKQPPLFAKINIANFLVQNKIPNTNLINGDQIKISHMVKEFRSQALNVKNQQLLIESPSEDNFGNFNLPHLLHLSDPKENSQTKILSNFNLAKLFSEMLLKPISNYLSKSKTVVFIPDNDLNLIPFPFLEFNKSQLIDTHASFLSPSLTSLLIL